MNQRLLLQLIGGLLAMSIYSALAQPENEIIANLKKAERIYIVRQFDGVLFLLLDKSGKPFDGQSRIDKVLPSFRLLKADALCLEGRDGNGLTVYTLYRKCIYFTDKMDARTTPARQISEVLSKTGVGIDQKVLNNYMGFAK